MLDEIVQN